MDKKPTILVTEHAEFLRAVKGDEIRYFPSNAPNARTDALSFDEDGDFDPVQGFGVYDTTVSTSFAVGLYATKAEAETHLPTPEPAAPFGIFKNAGVNQKKAPGKRKR